MMDLIKHHDATHQSITTEFERRHGWLRRAKRQRRYRNRLARG